MVSPERFTQLALSFPEVQTKSHFGQPDFRVRNKIFAGLSRDGSVGNLKLTTETQFELIAQSPATFSPCQGAWGRSGWTYVKLSHAEPTQLKSLLQRAWASIAPKALAGDESKRARTTRRKR